jgi:hypothetical protein
METSPWYKSYDDARKWYFYIGSSGAIYLPLHYERLEMKKNPEMLQWRDSWFFNSVSENHRYHFDDRMLPLSARIVNGKKYYCFLSSNRNWGQ